jgi:hypothetical protein
MTPGLMRDAMPRPGIWGTAIGAAAVTVYLLRLDDVAGLIVDDAWYVVLAKALAQGDGYRLVSSGTAQILPVVPPGFPLLLSPIFGVNAGFPANVVLLKAVSIAAMLALGVVTYRYLTGIRRLPAPLAAAAALATILTPAFVFLATSTVMAECVFTLGQIGAVWSIDRAARAPAARDERRLALLAGVVAALAWLVRSAGVAAVATGIVLLLWRRRWASAALFGLAATAVYAPWLVYAQSHAPTAAERTAHGGAIAYSYADLLRFREGGVQQSGRATVGDLAGRISGNLVSIFGKDTGAIVVPVAYRGPGESGQEVVSIGASRDLQAGSMGNSAGTHAISFLLSAVALAGFVVAARQAVTAAEILVPLSVAMIALVPAWSFRYTLTLTPFILYYLVTGIEVCLQWMRRRSTGLQAAGAPTAAARIAVLTILGLQILDHARYVILARDPTSIEWLSDAAEAEALLDWMGANLPSDGVVASTNPGLVYLRTGRKTVASDDPSQNWERWQAIGVRHMAALRPIDLPPSSLGYDVLHVTPRRRLWVIELSPDSQSSAADPRRPSSPTASP